MKRERNISVMFLLIGFISLLGLTGASISVYFLHEGLQTAQDNYQLLKEENGSLKNELKEVKAQKNRAGFIAVSLYNYVDYRKVKKDTALVNRMIIYSENE